MKQIFKIIVAIHLFIISLSIHAQTANDFRAKANNGDAYAQYALGVCYANGIGVSQDYSQAVYWFKKSSEQGNADAQRNLGICYKKGIGVSQDYSQAVHWLKKSAEQGNAQAQANLGCCYTDGTGVSQDYSQAAYWLKKSAEQGNADAQVLLGNCYEEGKGVPLDYSQFVYWYKKAAEQGNANAQVILGTCYKNGKGVTQDYSQAVYWYKEAAEQGNVNAYANIGALYLEGKGISKNATEAQQWFLKAAEKNDLFSLHKLGEMNMNGLGIPQDVTKGLYYYQKASDLGSDVATIELAKQYAYGVHVKQDIDKAKQLLKPLIEKGDWLAEFTITTISSPDFGLKKTDIINENTFAIVISNTKCDNYVMDNSFYQDAECFNSFCEKSFGIPKNHIHRVVEPTLANLIMEFDWLQSVMEAFDGEANAIIYYAGPGASDESTSTPYIIPTDGDAAAPSSGFSLNELYGTLCNMPSKSILVVLDACFNGTKRNGEMIASARGVKIKAKNELPKGNIVVFNASQKDETAWGVDGHAQGLFTNTLLNTIKEAPGDITLGELSQKVITKVKRQVIVNKGVSQTPIILSSSDLGDNWKNWKLKP